VAAYDCTCCACLHCRQCQLKTPRRWTATLQGFGNGVFPCADAFNGEVELRQFNPVNGAPPPCAGFTGWAICCWGLCPQTGGRAALVMSEFPYPPHALVFLGKDCGQQVGAACAAYYDPQVALTQRRCDQPITFAFRDYYDLNQMPNLVPCAAICGAVPAIITLTPKPTGLCGCCKNAPLPSVLKAVVTVSTCPDVPVGTTVLMLYSDACGPSDEVNGRCWTGTFTGASGTVYRISYKCGGGNNQYNGYWDAVLRCNNDDFAQSGGVHAEAFIQCAPKFSDSAIIKFDQFFFGQNTCNCTGGQEIRVIVFE